ncbi:hypothetical protein [Pleionea sp. CnH1-48]|uniref:hypothetical protein n=1 Tax=Pleionea sp. CnH1-48 TaxID=2954494 RepID=UPI0020979ABE|nr:hypothetical protein [Pleionea sp. CnH1-48]MCO7223234.1 hypothetical protein [Pleionea sp. CnH1-48]
MKIKILTVALFANMSWAEEAPIKLESNFIGDKEQPSVSYFIPWKDIGTPDKLQWQMTDKHDKTLELVDRKILLRSSGMYKSMQLEQGSSRIQSTQK